MANFYDDWKEPSEENKERLRNRVWEHCKSSPAKTLDGIADSSGFKSLRRWLNQNEDHRKILDENYYRLVLIGLRDKWLGRDDRSLYRLFAAFIGYPIPDSGLLVGTAKKYHEHYEVYRYSLLASGYVLRGRLDITYESEQIITSERYRIQAEAMKESGRGEVERIFPRFGLLFPRGPRSYMMISMREGALDEVETAFLHVGPDLEFQGRFSDWHGDDFYAARLLARKRQRQLEESEIKALKPNEVAPRIIEYLTKALKDDRYVVVIPA